MGYHMGGLSGASEDLAKVRAERAQVSAEIARLQGGGAPVAGGFSPGEPRAPDVGAISSGRSRNRLLLGGAALLVAGVFFLSARKR